MKPQLEQFIRANVKTPSEPDISAILDIFEEKTYSKGATFKEVHTISHELGFIVEGSARTMVIKENGDEVTGGIASQHRFIADLISVRNQETTPISIQFLEESSILSTPIPKMKALLETNLTFNILIREHIAERAAEMGKWHLMFLTSTARERYRFILDHNPDLLKKFPLRLIASIIGITPTQLSRIRKQHKPRKA